ncbi:MAG: S1C family serine protease [Candidatus Omnitrophota bacterium]
MTKLFQKTFIIFSAVLSATSVITSLAFGQNSLIATVQRSLPSIVQVESQITGAYQSKGSSAAIHKESGRLIVLRNVKTAQYHRDGAGVIIDPRGLIVTNHHIVSEANKIAIILNDKQVVSGQVVWSVPEKDVAIVRIDPPYPLRAIAFADSQGLRLKDEVVTVGNSPVLKQTISGGKVIGLGTNASSNSRGQRTNDMLQLDINLYKGDSGGPVLNREGQLVGLMVAGQVKKDRSSFAIPSNTIRMEYIKYLETLK